jgi:hypothetical protein
MPVKAPVRAPVAIAVVIEDNRPVYRDYTLLSQFPGVPFAKGRFGGILKAFCQQGTDQTSLGQMYNIKPAQFVGHDLIDLEYLAGLLIAKAFRESDSTLHCVYAPEADTLSQYELVLRIDLKNMYLQESIITYGASLFGIYFNFLGLPQCGFVMSCDLKWDLVEAHSGQVLGTGKFVLERSAVSGFYYPPYLTVYSSDGLLGEFFSQMLRQVVGEVNQLLARQSPMHWSSLAKHHEAWRLSRGELLGYGVPHSKPKETVASDNQFAMPSTRFPGILDSSGFVLAIGIDDYTFLGKVPGCVADAKVVAKVFAGARGVAPSSVVVMTDDSERDVNRPTQRMIERRISGLVDEVKEDGVAFIYFSGHGIMRDKKLYLMAKDSDDAKEDGVSLQFVLDELARSKARESVLILDICRHVADKGVTGMAPGLKPQKRTALLLSCSENERSYPAVEQTSHSVYTRYLIGALGELSADPQKPVTVRALHDKVAEGMRQWRIKTSKRQTPQIILYGDQDFELIPARKQKGSN